MKIAGPGNTLPQYLPNPKHKFPFTFTQSEFLLLSFDAKAEWFVRFLR